MVASSSPSPVCRIFHDPDTQQYGFVVNHPGQRPHWEMNVFETMERAMQYVDPHGERIWEEPSDADESCVLISRAYKPGSVSDRAKVRSSR